MKYNNISGYKNINDYISNKLKKFENKEKNFETLFELMFSEKNNIIFEKSEGYKTKKITYSEFQTSILKSVNSFNNTVADIPLGSTIGIYTNDNYNIIKFMWIIIVCGYKPLLLNTRVSDKILNDALKFSDAKAVFSDGKETSVKTYNFSSINETEICNNLPTFGSELYVISSGTTNSIKICAYSAEEIYYQICDSFNIVKKCKKIKAHYKGELKILAFLPFYHIFGLSAVYFWFSFFSRTIVLLDNYSPDTIVNTVRKHKVTHIFAIPLFWETVYKKAMKTIAQKGEKKLNQFNKALKIIKSVQNIKFLRSILSRLLLKEVRDNMFGESIKFFISGGGAIKSDILEFFNFIGYRIVDGYGMSEIGITSVEIKDNLSIINSCSVGEPLNHISYKIDENGELYVKGKTLAKYIIENGNVTYIKDWFRTKDLAECVNGHYKILGRCDDVVISSNGENLNPNIIEPLIKLKNVNDICLIGPNINGSVISVLVVSVNRFISKNDFKEINQSVNEQLSNNDLSSKISKVVFVTDNLIETDAFKVNRMLIREKYENNEFNIINFDSIKETKETNDLLLKTIFEYFEISLDSNNFNENSNFFTDLGGSSLDYFAMIAKLSDEFSITFPSSIDECPKTPKEIHKFINSRIYNVNN